jgi:hypothetical protein
MFEAVTRDDGKISLRWSTLVNLDVENPDADNGHGLLKMAEMVALQSFWIESQSDRQRWRRLRGLCE